MTKSKTQAALDYLARNPKATPYQAAKHAGTSASVVYRAIERQKKPRCPCCGRPLAQ